MWTNLGERGYSSLKDGHKTHYSSGRTILASVVRLERRTIENSSSDDA